MITCREPHSEAPGASLYRSQKPGPYLTPAIPRSFLKMGTLP